MSPCLSIYDKGKHQYVNWSSLNWNWNDLKFLNFCLLYFHIFNNEHKLTYMKQIDLKIY